MRFCNSVPMHVAVILLPWVGARGMGRVNVLRTSASTPPGSGEGGGTAGRRRADGGGRAGGAGVKVFRSLFFFVAQTFFLSGVV